MKMLLAILTILLSVFALQGCVTTTGENIKDSIVKKVGETRREINEKFIRSSSKSADNAIKDEKYAYCKPIRGDVILDNFCDDNTCEKWVKECKRTDSGRIDIRIR